MERELQIGRGLFRLVRDTLAGEKNERSWVFTITRTRRGFHVHATFGGYSDAHGPERSYVYGSGGGDNKSIAEVANQAYVSALKNERK